MRRIWRKLAVVGRASDSWIALSRAPRYSRVEKKVHDNVALQRRFHELGISFDRGIQRVGRSIGDALPC